MSEILPREAIARFDQVVKLMGAAIKNSELYTARHPSLIASLEALHRALGAWFSDSESLAIGITHDDLLLNGAFVKENAGAYAEIARYLHEKHFAAVSFLRGVTVDELSVLLRVSKVGLSPEGVNALKGCAHLSVKELDYSALLHGGESAGTGDEGEVWRSLSHIGTELRSGQLPESKAELVTTFLKDAKRSASVLNSIYRDALARLDTDAAVKEMRTSLTDIARHFKDAPAGYGEKNVRKDIADILLNLDPSLVAKLFEESQDAANADLSKEVLKDFSDEMVADFILGLVGEDGRINENLLKLFDKLVADPSRATDLTALVTDKLVAKQMMSPQLLSTLHSSMKELLRDHGGSEFLSGMYKLTVDVFVDKHMNTDIGEAHAALGKECAAFMSEENLIREKAGLFLNLIWLERDPAECEKLVTGLTALLPVLTDPKFLTTLADVYDLAFVKLKASSDMPPAVQAAAGRLVPLLSTDDMAQRLVSFVAHVPDSGGGPLVKMLCAIAPKVAGRILAEYTGETHPPMRRRYGDILISMGGAAVSAIVDAMDLLIRTDAPAAKELFRMLKRLDKDAARSFSGRMIAMTDPEIRLEAFEDFAPATDADTDAAFSVIAQEPRAEIKQKILALVLQKGDQGLLKRFLDRRAIDRYPKTALEVIKLCGDLKVNGAFPYLAQILGRRTFFGSKRLDELQVASLVSIARFGTKESEAVVEEMLHSRRPALKRMAAIIRELGQGRPDAERG